MILKSKVKDLSPLPLDKLIKKKDGETVVISGTLTSVKEYKDEIGGKILVFAMLSDGKSNCEVIVFPSVYAGTRAVINSNNPVLIEGTVRVLKEDEGKKLAEDHIIIIAEKVHSID
ncbi:MAG: hypothetical protein M1491_03450 [Deltaproteobacteria bacterium]|nr:hypothetical protein [Deltaproteobacteria bacterium]MCL5277827.1 hypothetical protein [Deltaproteobacteria bacterium]